VHVKTIDVACGGSPVRRQTRPRADDGALEQCQVGDDLREIETLTEAHPHVLLHVLAPAIIGGRVVGLERIGERRQVLRHDALERPGR
jgi:hypothetical protein